MKTVAGWAFPSADEFMCRELKADGTYQASHLRMALAHVVDHRVAIDGGAHVGTWSRLMAGIFARVIAVEPSADTFEALAENVKRFALTNVETRPVALGAHAGLVKMVLDGRGAAMKNTGARHMESGGSVRCEAIDDWHLSSLGFLKLDIEGSEPFALAGATETIARCRPVVLFENKYLWKRFGQPREAPQMILMKLGFRFLEPAGCDEIWGPR